MPTPANRPRRADSPPPPTTLYDNTAACIRCGRDVRSVGRIPLDPLRKVICTDCSNLNERPS